jgi:hypothetical protein
MTILQNRYGSRKYMMIYSRQRCQAWLDKSDMASAMAPSDVAFDVTPFAMAAYFECSPVRNDIIVGQLNFIFFSPVKILANLFLSPLYK